MTGQNGPQQKNVQIAVVRRTLSKQGKGAVILQIFAACQMNHNTLVALLWQVNVIIVKGNKDVAVGVMLLRLDMRLLTEHVRARLVQVRTYTRILELIMVHF